MGSPSALSLFSHPNVSIQRQTIERVHRGQLFDSCTSYCFPLGLFPAKPLVCINRGRLKRLVLKAAASSRGDVGPGRRVYTESQGQDPLSAIRVKEFATFVVPAGAFLAIALVLWKLSEKLLPKPSTYSSVASEPPMKGMKWSFSPGTSLLQSFGAKVGGESRQRLNQFAKELRSSSRVDISGCNLGDDGIFFLAESLAYNQAVEEVNFAANGITAAGLQAFDGVLQSNMLLKTLNLSGNPIGDSGAKGRISCNKDSSSRFEPLRHARLDTAAFSYFPPESDGCASSLNFYIASKQNIWEKKTPGNILL